MEPPVKASTRESVSLHNASPGHVSFDERSFRLTTLAVKCFGRLGEEGYELSNELATHAAASREGGSMARKGVVKKRLLQVISVSMQVAMSRRAHRYKLWMRNGEENQGRVTRNGESEESSTIWG
ncbi:unnamed protein product [Scytosiphon promiscuus]